MNQSKVCLIPIHPSIYFLYLLNPSIGSRGGWSQSQQSLGERQGTPWTGHQSITGPHNHTHAPKDNLESPINLTCMFLDSGRKLEYPERTHAYTGRTCELHTERPLPQPGVEPGTLLLWGDGANHHTTVQPTFNTHFILISSLWLDDYCWFYAFGHLTLGSYLLSCFPFILDQNK